MVPNTAIFLSLVLERVELLWVFVRDSWCNDSFSLIARENVQFDTNAIIIVFNVQLLQT